MSIDVDWLTGFCDVTERAFEEEQRRQRYLTDPVAWIADSTGEFMWSKQRELLEAVVKHKKVAVKAGHGVGKSMSVSRLIAWWVAVHPKEQTRVITTAPSWEQVEGVIWTELQIAHDKAGGAVPGVITGDCKWRIGRFVVAKGRKPADRNKHGVQGTHAPFVLAVGDEACGLSGEIIEGLANIVTGDQCRILLIGNPDDPNTRFGQLCDGSPTDGSSGFSKAGWYVINISVLDNPYFTGEDVPEDLLVHMPKEDYLDDKRKEVGEGSPLWISKVLGQFPEDTADGVIPSSWLEKARRRQDEWTAEKLRVVHLGIDVGGSDNGDKTVVWERRGPLLGRRWDFQMKDHIKLAVHIVNIISETGAHAVKIDVTGVGHGLAQILRSYGEQGHHNAVVLDVIFGGRAHDPVRFKNIRAEMFWMMRELVQQEAVDLRVLGPKEPGDRVCAELTMPNYKLDPTGRVVITPKEEIKERLDGRSPDDADAVLMAYYTPPVEAKGYTWNR